MAHRSLALAAGLLCIFSAIGQDLTDSVWSLESCLRYAVQNNLTVKQAVLTENSATLDYQQAKMNRFPNLFASATQSVTNGRSIDPITSDFVSQTIHSTSLGLNSVATLYNGGKLNNQIRQQKIVVEQNTLYVQETKNTITLSVTEAYLLADYYYEGVRAAENTLRLSEQQLEQGKAKLEAGSSNRAAVAELQSLVAQNRHTLVQTQNQYAQQLLTLKQLLELEPGTGFDIQHTDLKNGISIIPDKQTVYANALEIMPEIKAAELQKQVAGLDRKIAHAGYLPSLSLSAALASGYTNTQSYNFSDQIGNNFNQRISLSLSIPIYSRNENKTNIEKAKISLQNSELQLTQEQKDLYRKIETAWQNATSAQSEMQSAETALEAAKYNYDLVQEQFNRGATDAVNLAVGQNTLLNAQQSFLQAKYMSMLYVNLLDFYQGKTIK
jgi:outer membrane protein